MKINLKINFKQILSPIKPDWRRIILFIILFLVLPQKISDGFIFFGGVYIIKSLFESLPPTLDLSITVVMLIVSYLLASLVIWLYDKKINKFIMSEGEIEVQPEEKKEEQKPAEESKEEPQE